LVALGTEDEIKDLLFTGIDDLLRAMMNHIQKFFLVRSYITRQWPRTLVNRYWGMRTFVDLGPALLNDKLVEAQLLGSALEHPFFDRILGIISNGVSPNQTMQNFTSVMSRNTNTCFV